MYTVFVDKIPVGSIPWDSPETPYREAEAVAGVVGWTFPADGASVTQWEHTVGVSINFGSNRPKKK